MPESSNGGIVLIVLIIISLIVILLSSTGKLLDKPSKLSADASISVIRAQVNTVDTQDQSTNPTKTVPPTTQNDKASLNTQTSSVPFASTPSTTTTTTTTTTTPTPTPPLLPTSNTLTSTQFTAHLRFPPTIVGAAAGPLEIIDLKDQTGTLDAGFVCKPYHLSKLLGKHHTVDSHLIQMKPIVTEIEQYGSIVHHMDIFSCIDTVHTEYEALTTRRERSNWCSQDKFLDSSCKQLMWVYDRGANTFNMPAEAGILFGPSTGFNSLVLQIHYLLPKQFVVGNDKSMIDSSGFELIFDTKLRPNDSSMFGFLDFSINIPPNSQQYVFENHIDSQTLADMIAPDLLKYGHIIPFGMHLHAHNHAKAVRLEHYRGDVQLKTYDSIKPFHGYGVDQTFRHFLLKDGREPILPGDSLTFVCTFDTTDATRPTYYGVSHGDEMCAPVILYYPHTRGTTGYNVVNMKSFETSKHRSQDTSAEKVMNQLKGRTGRLRR